MVIILQEQMMTQNTKRYIWECPEGHIQEQLVNDHHDDIGLGDEAKGICPQCVKYPTPHDKRVTFTMVEIRE